VTAFKDTFFYTKKTSGSGGQLIDWTFPRIMGILNCTPDSFYDGGKNNAIENALVHAAGMIGDGAEIIDIGGYSSRPGAADVTEKEEIERVVPVIKTIRKQFPHILISIDTFRANVAAGAIDAGANIINDISGGTLDPDMFSTAAVYKVPYILMHSKGTPQTMNSLTSYEDLINEMLGYFIERTALAREAGIRDIIIDPGFGFAKTIDQNYELLKKLSIFSILNLPVLVGVSRKSMIYKTLESSASEALNGTTVLHAMALMNRIQILRVHDIKEAKETIQLVKRILN